MYLGGSPSFSQRTMTEFYQDVSMQALSKSDNSVRLEFIAIVDLVENIAQLLNDKIEATIVSTKEGDRYFAFFLDEKDMKQQNMDEIDKTTTEDSVETKKSTPPTVPSEDEVRKRNRQIKESFIQTKMEIDQPDLYAIERADRENKERLIRHIVNPTEDFTVNRRMTLQDLNLPESNSALPLQLPPNVNTIIDGITSNVLTEISRKTLPDLPEPETIVIDTDVDQTSETETINYFKVDYIGKIITETLDEQQQIPQELL